MVHFHLQSATLTMETYKRLEREFREFFWPSERHLTIYEPKDEHTQKSKALFYYINHGDFDLALLNVGVFIFGHIMAAITVGWLLVFGVAVKTILWSEHRK